MSVIIQQKQAAEALGVTPRTLRDWQNVDGFPDCSRGYDVEAIRTWRQANERKGSEPERVAKQIKLGVLAEKLKQMQLRTKKDQLDLDAKEGTLLPRKAIEQSAAVLLSALGDWCEQLPDLVAAIVSKKDQRKVRDRLKTELDARREQLADDLKALGGSS